MTEQKFNVDQLIDDLKAKAFQKKWSKNILKILNVEKLRINSLVIGSVDFCTNRLYVGANTNKILVFDLNGIFLETSIELNSGVEVKSILISDILSDEGEELIILTNDDTLYFYGYNLVDNTYFQYRDIQFHHPFADITACVPFKDKSTQDKGLIIGDSKGNVFIKRPDEVDRNPHLDKPFIDAFESEELISVWFISGSKENAGWRIIVAYQNGKLYLLGKDGKLINEFDLAKDILNLVPLEKQGQFIVYSEYPYVACLTIDDHKSNLKWEYDLVYPVSSIIPIIDKKGEHGLFTISEDSEQIVRYNSKGSILYYGDPSFQGSAGICFNDQLFLASNEGEVCQFNMPNEYEILKTTNQICSNYEKSLKAAEFYADFFDEQFSDDDNLKYFREFLVKKLSADPVDNEFIDSVDRIFLKKAYDTSMEEGILSKICSSSILKKQFLESFKNRSPYYAIKHFEKQLQKGRIHFNSETRATEVSLTDPLKSLEILEELRLLKLDFYWKYELSEDDDIIELGLYPDPKEDRLFQILVATKKGLLILINRITGKPIWSMDLKNENHSDSNIVNLAISDIFGNNDLEIILGLENARNEILIISTKSDLHAQHQQVNLYWFSKEKEQIDYNLYLAPVTISGVKKHNIHKVKCFDFNDDGKKDLFIFSEGFYSIGIFKDNEGQFETKNNRHKETITSFELFYDSKGSKILLTGNDQGDIYVLQYIEGNLVEKELTYETLDRISDIKILERENTENDILISSADNHIYCLSGDLKYKWSFKTRGNVNSISINRSKELIFVTSADAHLYALDYSGNREWDINLGKPLNKIIESDNNLFLSDDKTVYSAMIIDETKIENSIEKLTKELKTDSNELFKSDNRYLRIFAARKILSKSKINSEEKTRILNLLNDSDEYEDIVREETYKNLAEHIYRTKKYEDEFFHVLLDGTRDHAPDVQISSIRACFDLFEGFLHKESDLKKRLIELTKDDNLWVKDTIAGELADLKLSSDTTILLVWDILISLLENNLDEDWILSEASESLAKVLNKNVNPDLFLTFCYELFRLDLDLEIFEVIRSRIINPISIIIFDNFYSLKFLKTEQVLESFTKFMNFEAEQKIKTESNSSSYCQFYNDISHAKTIISNYHLDNLLADIDGLTKYLKSLRNSSNEIIYFLDLLKSYQQSEKNSEKVYLLNEIINSNITDLDPNMKEADYRIILFNFLITKHLIPILKSKIELLKNTVNIYVEDVEDDVHLSSDGTANISFQLLNGSLISLKNMRISLIENEFFDFVNDTKIQLGDLYPDQKKSVNIKIRPKNINQLSIRFIINSDDYQAPEANKININLKQMNELVDYIDNQDLKAQTRQLIKYLKTELDSYMSLSDFNWMVNHGLKHIQNVYNYALKFLQMYPDVLESLNDFEIYILINGIWLHDIGMSDLRKVVDVTERRKSHGRLSAVKIKTDSNFNSKIFPEFIKAIGQLCIYHQSKSPIDEEHDKILGEKKIKNSPIKEILEFEYEGKEITIRLRFLASILSMADAIDIGEHRIEGSNKKERITEYIEYMNKIYDAKIDLENSVRHFKKHEAIENILFGDKEILLEDPYDGADDEVKVAALEGKKQLTDEIERCKRVFEKNGITDLQVRMNW